MKNRIKVIVEGPPNSGKTAVARLLSEVLDIHGVKNSVVDDPAAFTGHLTARLNAISHAGVEVEIQTALRAQQRRVEK